MGFALLFGTRDQYAICFCENHQLRLENTLKRGSDVFVSVFIWIKLRLVDNTKIL